MNPRQENPTLVVEDLRTSFATDRGELKAVDGVSFSVHSGRTLGVVGESGSGKSATARSIMNLLPPGSSHSTGRVLLDGRDVRKLSRKESRHVWGVEASMVFQNPTTSLNPVMQVGRQIAEGLRYHRKFSRDAAMRRARELLEQVGIADPGRRLREYPHQLSGGMQQRVMIAIALACEPKLLIADEPTTALDVTVQKQILDLLDRLRRQHRMAMILITHDLSVVAGRTDDLIVMYAGRIVERAPTLQLFTEMRPPLHEGPVRVDPEARPPQPHAAADHPGAPARPGHPAARLRLRAALRPCATTVPRRDPPSRRHRSHRPSLRLLLPRRHGRGRERRGRQSRRRPDSRRSGTGQRACGRRPRSALMAGIGTAHLRPADEVLLQVTDLHVEYSAGRGRKVSAVSGVSFDVATGETLGLVGESGCGKSTTARAVLQLPRPTAGQVVFDGVDLTTLRGEELRRIRTRLQMIFQDPIASLNPRRHVSDIVREGLDIWPEHLDGGSDIDRGSDIDSGAGTGTDGSASAHRPSTRRSVQRRHGSRRGGQPPPARVLRRPVPADLHRPGIGARPAGPHLRRAGVRPRCVHPGSDPEPPGGPEGPLPPDHAVHRPRPGGGEEHQRPGLRDVPRPDL